MLGGGALKSSFVILCGYGHHRAFNNKAPMIKSIFSLFSLEIFITSSTWAEGCLYTGPVHGFFDFGHSANCGEREYWGCGLHIVVSPLQIASPA